MTIPKILHFTWKTKTLTKFAQKIWDDWARTHPDWELRLWDDVDIRALVADHYPEHLATFDGYRSGIFRADAFRFFVLHRHGGIYADLDVEPKGRIDRLCRESECFVGAEPEIHVEENDGRYRGMPFVLCNAFMGSVAGHPFWQRCIDEMARCSASNDVVDATGPRFVNGVALRTPVGERPDVLLPNLWSPLSGWGRHCPTSEAYADAVAAEFRAIGRGEATLVSHLWRNSWFMPVFYKGPHFWRLPNRLQWWWRAQRHKALSGTVFAAPSRSYARQELMVPAEWPRLYLAVDLSVSADGAAIGSVLRGLDYPRDKLTIGFFGGENGALGQAVDALAGTGVVIETQGAPSDLVARHNEMLAAGRSKGHVVLIDGRIVAAPAGVLQAMVGADRPVVTVEVVGTGGQDRNDQTLLFNAEIFKALYRAGALGGEAVMSAGRHAVPLVDFRYLNIAPVTIVGCDMVLVRDAVVEAGIEFPDTPYKYQRDSAGFAIKARDAGFEVAALPNVTVTTSRA